MVLNLKANTLAINKVIHKLKVPKRTKCQENIFQIKIIMRKLNKINNQMLNHLGFACTKNAIIPVVSTALIRQICCRSMHEAFTFTGFSVDIFGSRV